VRRLLVMANVVSNSPILVTLMMEALSFSETSVLTRSTRRNSPEDVFLHGHRHKTSNPTYERLLQRKEISPVISKGIILAVSSAIVQHVRL
jgi:hypothetical protein